MWKDSTARKIVLPKPEARWILPASVISLLVACGAGVFGFSDGPPALTVTGKIVSALFTLGFLALAGAGLYAKRRSG